MVNNWKVKKIGSDYIVGRDSKTSFKSSEFVLTRGRSIYKSKVAAQKRASSLNK